MAALSKQDIQFLLALNASEVSKFNELALELQSWESSPREVLLAVRELINDDTLLFTRCNGSDYSDMTKEQSESLADDWENLTHPDIAVFLTKSGEFRWQANDWGISTERAKHLMFGNGGRVKSNA